MMRLLASVVHGLMICQVINFKNHLSVQEEVKDGVRALMLSTSMIWVSMTGRQTWPKRRSRRGFGPLLCCSSTG